jgi:hypothetical protein
VFCYQLLPRLSTVENFTDLGKTLRVAELFALVVEESWLGHCKTPKRSTIGHGPKAVQKLAGRGAMGCVVNAFTITVADSIQRRDISLITFPGVI